MNKKRLVTLSIIILTFSIILKLLIVGIQHIKIDEFKPVSVIFLLDTSEHNQKNNFEVQKKYLKQFFAK